MNGDNPGSVVPSPGVILISHLAEPAPAASGVSEASLDAALTVVPCGQALASVAPTHAPRAVRVAAAEAVLAAVSARPAELTNALVLWRP